MINNRTPFFFLKTYLKASIELKKEAQALHNYNCFEHDQSK